MHAVLRCSGDSRLQTLCTMLSRVNAEHAPYSLFFLHVRNRDKSDKEDKNRFQLYVEFKCSSDASRMF